MRMGLLTMLREYCSRLMDSMHDKSARVVWVAAMNDLRCGHTAIPTWHTQPDGIEQFWSGVTWLSLRRAIPASYAAKVSEDPLNCRRLLEFAGALEQRSVSFVAQQRAVVDLITEWWQAHLRAEALAERAQL